MNRKEFLLTSGGALLSASAGRVFGAVAPSDKVRLAIAGCHEKGRGICVMRAALTVPGVEIAWVCDVDSRARDFAAAEVTRIAGNVPRKEKDLRRVLEDPSLDGVILETPDHFHAYSAVLAMKAGKAVYVEKPCCFCPREGELLVEAWHRTGKVLQVGSQRRSSANYRAAIAWLQENGDVIGALKWAKCWYSTNRASIGRGKPAPVPEWLDWDLWQGPAPRTEFRDNYVHYNWHWFKRWGTAETGNNAPHFADVARWALGAKFPKRVVAGGGLLFPKGDDYAWPDTYNLSFEYPGDKLITFELASHTAARKFMDAPSGALVYGERGSVFFGPRDDVRICDDKGKELKSWGCDASTDAVSRTNPTKNLDAVHMADFVSCIRAGSQKTHVPADEGYMSSYMPLIGNIALETRESLDIDPETGHLIGSAKAQRLWRREYEKGWDLLKG